MGLNNQKNQLKDWILLGISILLFVIFIWLFSIPEILAQKTGSIEWYSIFTLIISTGLTFCAIIYFASSIYTPIKEASVIKTEKYREEAAKITESLFSHLKQIGLDVTVESKEPKELLDKYFILSSIRVANKNIDLIELEWQRTELDTDYGSSHTDYYQCTYVMQITLESIIMQQKLLARAKPVKEHFFSRQIINLVWEGKELAQTLNKDINLTAGLIFQHHIHRVQIIPHTQFIEIRQNYRYSSPNLAFPTLETFEAYNRIGGHIRSIAALS